MYLDLQHWLSYNKSLLSCTQSSFSCIHSLFNPYRYRFQLCCIPSQHPISSYNKYRWLHIRELEPGEGLLEAQVLHELVVPGNVLHLEQSEYKGVGQHGF